MSGVGAYVRAQIEEIRADPALRLYGVALLATHLLSAYWLMSGDRAGLAAAGADAICWPLVSDCERFRWLSAPQLQVLFAIYGAAALACMLGFARRRWTGFGWTGLLALTVLKLAIVALDFRLRRNQHYMAFAATGVFLLVPRKRESLQLLIVLFYFWAGTLKLNWEWLSGAALYRPLWLLTGSAVVAACAYVMLMELVLVWGLLSRRPWLFWASLAQVLLFHVMSWAVVLWFYPLLMFCLLSIFPLARLLPGDDSRSVGERIRARALAPSTLAVAAVFSLMQLSTHLYPGDTAITGEGRLFALHMFDARVICEVGATLKLADGSEADAEIEIETAEGVDGGRARCDPLVVRGFARNWCRHREAGGVAITDLDLHVRSRRATESELRPVVDLPDFCSRMPAYAPFLHNDWIRAD